ncbi:MAG: FHA domain-containing protein [Chloroflexi bacterium]|nr:MAG: FHA domain-containing protein [Chloroflexota bacterium]
MNPDVILLLLRILSAGLLLSFLGLFAWLIYRDLQVSTAVLEQKQQVFGQLRVIANELEAPAVNTTFPLHPLTSIGRTQSATIVIDDNYVSQQHALLTARGKQWWLEDLGSRNGTLLNGVLLTETAVVSSGDIITIGNVQLKVEL